MSDTLSRASGIVFDLDGTLVDSTYIHTLCWWQAMQQFGHERPMAAVHHAVGMGADHLLDHVLDPGRDVGQDDSITTAHDALFRDLARPNPPAARCAPTVELVPRRRHDRRAGHVGRRTRPVAHARGAR